MPAIRRGGGIGGAGKKAWKAGPDPYIFSAESKQAAEQLRDDHANNIANYQWLKEYREDPLKFIIIEDETNNKLFGQAFHSSDITDRTTYFGRTSPFGTPAKPNVALTGGTDPELGKKIYKVENQTTKNAFDTIASDFDHFKSTNNFLHLAHGDEEDEVEDIFVFTYRTYQEIWQETIGGVSLPQDPKTQYPGPRWSDGQIIGNTLEKGAGGGNNAIRRMDRTIAAFSADLDTHPWTLTVTDSAGEENTVNITNIERYVISGDEHRYRITFTQPTGGDIAQGDVSDWTIRARLATGRYDLVLVMGDSDDDSIQVAANVAANDWDINTLDYSHNWKELGGDGEGGGFRLGPSPNRFDSVEGRDTQAEDRRNVESWLDVYDEDETQVVRVIEGLTMRLHALKEYSEVDATVFGDDITDVRGEAIYTTGGGTVYNVDFEGAGAADAATALKTLIEGKPVHDRLVFKSGSAEAELDALTITALRTRQTIFGRTVGSATAPAKPAVAGVNLFASGNVDIDTDTGAVLTNASALAGAINNARGTSGATPIQISLTIGGTTHVYTINSATAAVDIRAGTSFGTVQLNLTRTSGGDAPSSTATITAYDITGLFPGTDRRVSFGFVGADESPFQAVPTANNWDIVDRNIEATWFDIGGGSGEGDARGELLFTSSALVGTASGSVLSSGDDLSNTWERDTSLPGFGWSATSATISFPELRPADNTIGAWIVVEDADGNETDEMMIPWGPSLQEGGATRQLRCAANIRIMVQFVQEGTRTAVWLEARQGDCTGYKVKIYLAKMSGRDGADGSGEDNVQPDWNETDRSKDEYIKNKPSIPNNASIDARIAGRFRANSPSGLEDGSFLRMTASGFSNVSLASLKTLIGSTTGGGGDSGVRLYSGDTSFTNDETAALNGKILLIDASSGAITIDLGDPGSTAVKFLVVEIGNSTDGTISFRDNPTTSPDTTVPSTSFAKGEYGSLRFDPATDTWEINKGAVGGGGGSGKDNIVFVNANKSFSTAEAADLNGKIIFANADAISGDLTITFPTPPSGTSDFVVINIGTGGDSVLLRAIAGINISEITLGAAEYAVVKKNSSSRWNTGKGPSPVTLPARVSSSERDANPLTATNELRQFAPADIAHMIGSLGAKERINANKTYTAAQAENLDGNLMIVNPESAGITITLPDYGSGTIPITFVAINNGPNDAQFNAAAGDNLALGTGKIAMWHWNRTDEEWEHQILNDATGGGGGSVVAYAASKTFSVAETAALANKIVYYFGNSSATFTFNDPGGNKDFAFVVFNCATQRAARLSLTTVSSGDREAAISILGNGSAATASWDDSDAGGRFEFHETGRVRLLTADASYSTAETRLLHGKIILVMASSDITITLMDPGVDEAFNVINLSGNEVTIQARPTSYQKAALTLTRMSQQAACFFDRSEGTDGQWIFESLQLVGSVALLNARTDTQPRLWTAKDLADYVGALTGGAFTPAPHDIYFGTMPSSATTGPTDAAGLAALTAVDIPAGEGHQTVILPTNWSGQRKIIFMQPSSVKDIVGLTIAGVAQFSGFAAKATVTIAGTEYEYWLATQNSRSNILGGATVNIMRSLT